MRRRHPLPRRWLMTDERLGDALWPALDRLPRGAGVVFRHYSLPIAQRRALLAQIERVAKRRGLVVVAAGGLVASGGAHNGRSARGLRTRSAHGWRDIVAAARSGADAVFVSPVFVTRSHPGARTLGTIRFGLSIRGARLPVVALGGIDASRARRLARFGIYGWAAIDAWSKL